MRRPRRPAVLRATVLLFVVAVVLFVVSAISLHAVNEAATPRALNVPGDIVKPLTTTTARLIVPHEEELAPFSMAMAEAALLARTDECAPGLAVYGSAEDTLGSRASCLFASVEINARRPAKRLDTAGLRLPWFSPTGQLFVACAAWAHFFSASPHALPLLPSAATSSAMEKSLDALDKECHAGRLRVRDYVARVAETSAVSPDALAQALRAFFERDDAGRAWLQAITRAHALSTPFGPQPREFALERDEERWAALLPSEAAGRALGDVNTFEVRLPARTTRVLVASDASVDARGRVVAMGLGGRFEAFYPRIAPWAFKALMLDPQGPYRKNMTFAVNNEQRQALLAELRAGYGQDCLDAARALLRAGRFDTKTPCSKGVAVARVVVLSQHLSREMFHFLCESLPRAGAVLDWLRRDGSVFVHATDCARKVGYCASLLQALGVAPERLVDGVVFAAQVVVPAGGRGHWPLANLWGIEAVAHAVREQLVARTRHEEGEGKEEEKDEEQANEEDCTKARVLIVKRKSTRLSPFPSGTYDAWARAVAQAFPWATVRFFDDADRSVMATMEKQVSALRWADVLVGAHGAAMSWIPYLRGCTHVVSLRGRSNSDIYEHLALGFGVGLHHAHFRYAPEASMDEIITGVGDALVVQQARRPPVRLMAVVERSITLPFAAQRVAQGCAPPPLDDDDYTHVAIARSDVSAVSPELANSALVRAELGRFEAVAFFPANDRDSALVLVDFARRRRVRACAMTEDELADQFSSVLVIKGLSDGRACVGVDRPYSALSEALVGDAAYARAWTRGAWGPALPLPRDLCAMREPPTAASLGEAGRDWVVKPSLLVL